MVSSSLGNILVEWEDENVQLLKIHFWKQCSFQQQTVLKLNARCPTAFLKITFTVLGELDMI